MIKFLDLHKINERFRAEFDARIKGVLDSGWYLQGKGALIGAGAIVTKDVPENMKVIGKF